MALPGCARPDGTPRWHGGGRLHDSLTLPRLRQDWAAGQREAGRSGVFRFTAPERAEIYRHAAATAERLRHCTAGDPGDGADAAWAAADTVLPLFTRLEPFGGLPLAVLLQRLHCLCGSFRRRRLLRVLVSPLARTDRYTATVPSSRSTSGHRSARASSVRTPASRDEAGDVAADLVPGLGVPDGPFQDLVDQP